MLKLIVLLRLFQFLNALLIIKSQQNNDLVQVIYRIVASEEIKNSKIVDVFSISKNTSEDDLRELFRKVGSEVTIKEVYKSQNSSRDRPWFFNIIIVDSLAQFRDIEFEDKRFAYGGYFIILYEEATHHEAHEIFKYLWTSFYIYNVNLIRRDKGDAVVVETFLPFQPQKCNQTEPMEIARFVDAELIPPSPIFFPKKFENFHECPIKVSTFASIGPSVVREDFPNGTHRLFGRDIDILTTISERLLFHPEIFFNSTYGGWGSINMKGEGIAAFMHVKLRAADLTFGNLNLKIERAIHLGLTMPYAADTLLFLIPPGRPLGTFEKLLRPFDKVLWITLCCVLVLALLTISILELQTRGVRDFVIGSRIKAAYLNVLIAVIGGAQTKLPKGNFARFLLMIFLLFCLVLRTLYQGSLFHFLQSSDSERDPENLQEMAIERNYTFYMILSYTEFSRENVYMKGKVVLIDPLRIQEMMMNVLDPSFHGALMLKLSQVLYSNRERAMRNEQLFKVCKDYFMMIPITMYFPKNSYLVEPFNRLLLLFQQSGLLNYWTSINEDMKFLEFHADDPSEPKRLTLEHLSGPFQIWLVGLLISLGAFFVETFWHQMSSNVRYVTTVRRVFSMGELKA